PTVRRRTSNVEASRSFLQAASLYENTNRPVEAAAMLVLAGDMLRQPGIAAHLDSARALYARAAATQGALGAESELLTTRVHIADRLMCDRGDAAARDTARAILEDVLKTARRRGDWPHELEAIDMIFLGRQWMRPDSARNYARLGAALAEAHADTAALT